MTLNRSIGLMLALLVFLVDQGTKLLVTGWLGISYEGAVMEILPFFDLRYIENNGVSLGFLQATSDLARWLLVGLTGAIAAGVLWWMLRERRLGDIVALGLVLGGALGNIVDRTRLGFVVDFADLHFGTWRPFMIFNVADAAITIGVVVLLVRALTVREKPPEPRPQMENEVNA